MAVTYTSFKAYFARDFSYYSGSGDSRDYVTDDDITRAITEAGLVFPSGLFSSSETLADTALLYLSAHFLSEDIQFAAGGAGGTSAFPVNHKAVGAVLESSVIPEWVTKIPSLYTYANTRYGQRYLSMLFPMLIGNTVVFEGATTP